MKTKKSGGSFLVLAAALVGLLVGVVLLFVPQIQVINICFLFAGACMAAGIVMIVRYFTARAFRNMQDYSFAFGVLLVLLAACMLVRIELLVLQFMLCMGLLCLFLGVVLLQFTVQLNSISTPVWWAYLLVSAAALGTAVAVIIDPFPTEELELRVACILLIAESILLGAEYLLSMLLVKRFVRKEDAAEAERQAARGMIVEDIPAAEVVEAETLPEAQPTETPVISAETVDVTSTASDSAADDSE